MVNVILRQEAINDLNEIWKYTLDKRSEIQADKYYDSLKFALKEIGEIKEIGKKYKGVNDNLLGFKTCKHIIFYHIISNNEIEIIRILHERMDLAIRIEED